MDFTHRNRNPELMDDPNMAESVLQEVLKDLNRTNYLLNGNVLTVRALERLLRSKKESYTIMDVGCGDGAMLRWVVRWCRKRNYQVKCIGLDLNEKSLCIAERKSADFPEIHYVRQNVLDDTFSENFSCDIILCTLTMHHLYDEHIPAFLGHMAKLARIGIVINDLQRSRLAYCLFKVFSAIFIHSEVAKNDGLLSIKSGFTKSELICFSKNIVHMTHHIQWKWAFRYVWVMETRRLTKSYA